MLKFNLLIPFSDSAKQNLQLYSFYLNLWLRILEFQLFTWNFSYDNFLKILKPVQVFSFAHDVLLLLLQLRG